MSQTLNDWGNTKKPFKGIDSTPEEPVKHSIANNWKPFKGVDSSPGPEETVKHTIANNRNPFKRVDSTPEETVGHLIFFYEYNYKLIIYLTIIRIIFLIKYFFLIRFKVEFILYLYSNGQDRLQLNNNNNLFYRGACRF